MSKLIPLTQGKFALVDDEDYERLSKFKWYYHNGYAARLTYDTATKKRKLIFMHRLILNTPDGKYTDHRDGNELNNMKSNLRICSTSQNMQNQRPHQDGTSVFKGVCWHKGKGKWLAYIKPEGKQKHLGYFKSETKAAFAYDEAAIALFGEFAKTNFHQK